MQRFGLVAGGGVAHVAPGVDWGVVHANFVVDVGTGGAAADAGVANDFTALHASAGDDGVCGKMRVPSCESETVIDNDDATVTGVLIGADDDAVGGGVNRSAIVGANVDASVEGTFTRERIEAFAEAVGDMSEDRPDGRRVIGIGKSTGRNQTQATGGNGDSGGVAFQKRVLLNGTIEGILGSGFIVDEIESRRVIAHDAVGHGNFGG